LKRWRDKKMALLGIQLTLLIGPTVPLPAPSLLVNSLERVEVTHSDEGRSGFQMTFKAGRGSPFNPLGYPLLRSSLLKPFSRVILLATFNAMPQVLMDGIITDQQLTPNNEPGASMLTVTGEDVSVMMDLEEKLVEHPAQPELVIANKIIGKYAKYGLIPMVMPPPVVDVPLPTERVPVQRGSDLSYLQEMAARYDYLFYITPGPAPGVNRAYWGPPKRVGLPQPALTLNMGSNTNVASINFRYDGLAAHTTVGQVQDRKSNETKLIEVKSTKRIPLSRKPALRSQSHLRQIWLEDVGGLTEAAARARAQARTDASLDQVVTASGELDAVRYGRLLKPRQLVGVRGVGESYGGMYYVKQVSHTIDIDAGTYQQSFTLTRSGVGSLTPVVRP
jgi:hypothetical protein